MNEEDKRITSEINNFLLSYCKENNINYLKVNISGSLKSIGKHNNYSSLITWEYYK